MCEESPSVDAAAAHTDDRGPATGRRLDVPARLAVLAVLAALVAFGPHVRNGFLYDDHVLVERNPAVNGAGPLRDVFTKHLWYSDTATQSASLLYYRPLFVLELRALWALGGGASWPFHVWSLLLHVVNVLLVFAAVGRLASRRWAGAVALLFAIHPLNGEVVYWASGDLTLLAALLGALLAVDESRAPGASPDRRFTLLSGAFLATSVAMFFKETALVIPLLVTLEALRAPRDRWLARLGSVWPTWVPVPLYLGVRALALSAAAPVGVGMAFDGTGARLVRACAIVAWHLRRLVWPFPLSPLHGAPDVSPAGVAIAILTLAVAATIAAWVAAKRPRELLWVCWILLPLLPPIAQCFQAKETPYPLAERYLFLSIVPALVLAVRLASWALDAAGAAPRSRAAVLAAVGAGIALATGRYGEAFDGDRAYARAALRIYPDHAIALSLEGEALARAGDLRAALPVFERVAVAQPGLALAHLNIGLARAKLGLPGALPAFQMAVALDPRSLPALLGLAAAYRDAGDLQAAGRAYARAVQAAPGDADARVGYGAYLYTAGERADALRQWEAALALAPYHCEALYDVGFARRALERGGAAPVLQRFLAACPVGYDAQRAQVARWLGGQ